MYKCAIIFSCFNRKDTTVRCLKSLLKATKKISDYDFYFYIWDDNSTDGTVRAIREVSNKLIVFEGPGNYFWSKSMYYAMKEAVRENFDFYLMVNDDVLFYPDSLETMFDSYESAGGRCAVVGSTEFQGNYTYGGKDKNYDGLIPNGKLLRCKYANWNCFLIDRYVINNVGLINPKYRHAAGDFDYSCRMNRLDIPQFVAAQYVGECELDHPIPRYYDSSIPLLQRFKELFAPKGQPIGSFFRLHWVDKRFKGLLIASYYYLIIIIRVIHVGVKKNGI